MYNRVLILTISIVLCLPNLAASQEDASNGFSPTAKGRMFFLWGYNRSAYSNSDISFSGDDYDFKLSDVVAKDRQSPFTFKTYFGLTSFTIPQYNFVIGYFLKDGLSISLNIDHMKYVVQNGQTSKITGFIDRHGSEYTGTYNNVPIGLGSDFLHFEHTDGLNYENIELTRHFDLWMSKNENIAINGYVGVAIGALIPRSNVRLLGVGTDQYHLAGFGSSATGGVALTLFKNWVIEYKVKGGFISMPDIVINGAENKDRAKQNFWFMERLFTVGANIPLKSNKLK